MSLQLRGWLRLRGIGGRWLCVRGSAWRVNKINLKYCLQIKNRIASMQRLKSQTSKKQTHKLQIRIPNFSLDQEQEEKKMQKHPKSKSSIKANQLYQSQNTEREPKLNNILHTLHHSLHSSVENQPIKSPRQPLKGTAAKIMKLKCDSKSPKSKAQSSADKYHPLRYKTEVFRTNLNTSRNIDQVKKKLQVMSTKAPIKLSGKYFKKEGGLQSKLQDMNKTLKKMAELKTSKKPRYQLKMLRRLGKSQTGDIILAVSNINGLVVAIKTFRKQKIKVEYLIDEMKIHLYCIHPNILPAYGYHIGKDEVFLVMQFGYHNLYEQILRAGPFSEEKTARYVSQILSGVQYLHRNGIIHRDLKPENVICFGDLLKITDFGWSIKTDKQRRTLCGTLDYISPEVAERNYYDNKIDCWSIGVLMYEMLTVQPPFSQSGQAYQFKPLQLPGYLSKDCCELIRQLLQVDPKNRISARQALDHAWLKQNKKNSLLFQRRKNREMEMQVDSLFEQFNED